MATTTTDLMSKPRISLYSLPPEILLRILSYIPPEDLTSASKSCLEFARLCRDYSLYKYLDLSGLPLESKLPVLIARHLHLTRSLTLSNHLLRPAAIREIFSILSSSKNLTHLDLTSLTGPRTILEGFLYNVKAPLVSVNLACTRLDSEPILALIKSHGATLEHLDLEFTRVQGCCVLPAISQNCTRLRKLGLGGCFRVDNDSMKNFLQNLPPKLEELDLRWFLDFRPEWVLPGTRMKFMDIRGSGISVAEVNDLRRRLVAGCIVLETATEEEEVERGGWEKCLEQVEADLDKWSSERKILNQFVEKPDHYWKQLDILEVCES